MTATAVPGLIYLPRWLDYDTEHEVLDHIDHIDANGWSTESRRRVQHYGQRYNVNRRRVENGAGKAIPVWAQALARRLSEEGHLEAPADQVIVNEYLPGQGLSAHIDCVPCFGPAIAAVFLGSACTMDFLPPERGKPVEVRLEPGSLSVMTGPARYTWRREIPARRSDPGPYGRLPRGRLVSLTFRTILTE